MYVLHSYQNIKNKRSTCTNCSTFSSHKQQDKGRPLPKFGEWDVNNPASAEGFTVIFNKARDEKKTNTAVNVVTPRRSDPVYQNDKYPPRKVKLIT